MTFQKFRNFFNNLERRDLHVSCDGKGQDLDSVSSEPDAVYDVGETHSCEPFNGWKVDGCMLRALLIAAYPNLEARVEKQITQ